MWVIQKKDYFNLYIISLSLSHVPTCVYEFVFMRVCLYDIMIV